jgi:DHA1 family bicyclomycin/chloramphenicol resistance-like MFS transporter
MGIGIVVLLASHFGLPHTHEPDTSISLKPKPIINFWSVMREPQFYTYAFTGAIALVIHVRRGLPYSFMDVFKVDATTYGWILPLCL